jgi:arylsulfatase
VKKRSHSITAQVNIPKGGAEGALVAAGGRFGGYALYLKQGKLFYSHNYLAEEIYTIESSTTVPEGTVQLRFEFVKMPLFGDETRGMGRLFINDTMVGERMIERSVPILYGFSDTFDIGADTVTPVVPDTYASPFPFTGTIEKITFHLN